MMLLILPAYAKAHDGEIATQDSDFQIMRTTCYDPESCSGTITCTGKKVHFGICGTDEAHLGMVAIVYTLDGEFLGYFECEDTGSNKEAKEGKRIDIWQPNRKASKEWIKKTQDYVKVKFIQAEG